MNEFSLIEKIKAILNNRIIGDDTAPIKIDGKTLLFTNDILLEGQHFLDYFPNENLGWKAISVNVSDIVASGGKPQYVLVSLLLPRNKTDQVKIIFNSIKKACQFYHCQVIGGNITKSEKLGIDIFMVGETEKFIGRRKAKPGDNIYLTGSVGDEKAGLELIIMKKKYYERFEKKLIKKFLRPIIDLDIADLIVKKASSSIDLSDGFSSDIYHISKLSKVRIDIDPKKIPISPELKLFAKKYKKNVFDYGLIGGEDYKIIFTSKKKLGYKKNLHLIGRVNPGKNVYLDKIMLIKKSFDHFSPS